MVSKSVISREEITRGASIGSGLPAPVVTSLEAQDRLCSECLQSPGLLCSGARLWPDSTSFLGFTRKPCFRIAANNALESVVKTLQSAGMRKTHALSVVNRILDNYGATPSIDPETRVIKIAKPRRFISPGILSREDVQLLILELSTYIVNNPSAVRILDCVYIPTHFYNQPETRDVWFGAPQIVLVPGVNEIDWTTAPSRQFAQWILDLMDNPSISFFVESSPLLPDAIRTRFV